MIPAARTTRYKGGIGANDLDFCGMRECMWPQHLVHGAISIYSGFRALSFNFPSTVHITGWHNLINAVPFCPDRRGGDDQSNGWAMPFHVNGRVLINGRGRAGMAVSNGETVVRTRGGGPIKLRK